MPITGVEQPEYITVDDRIRLRKYEANYDFALQWYQDKETLLLVDGKEEPYTIERLKGMYDYLDAQGELYFIEYKVKDEYLPIGDVTFWEDDMPIVIGDKTYRGQGIGYKVITKLIERAKALGYQRIYVDEIYDYNIGSQACFEKAGFMIYEKTEKGNKYCLNLHMSE